MADVAVALPIDLQEHRVLVAVDPRLAHREAVARGFALHPERVPRAAEERDVLPLLRKAPGFLVHEATHKQLAGRPVLHDRRHEPVQLVEIHETLVVSSKFNVQSFAKQKARRFPGGPLRESDVSGDSVYTRSPAGPFEERW